MQVHHPSRCLVPAMLIAIAAMGLSQPAHAAEGATCTDPNANLPSTLLGWGKAPTPMATAHDSAEASQHALPLGQRIAFKLANTDTVKFAHQPSEQMPKQYVYSGMASFHVAKDGNYTVMISEANWIDVIQNGQPIQSLQMRGRIPCAKYGKKIEFPLKNGEAIVQFFGAPYETVDVLVAPAP
jgi:hypothetical protein